MSKNLLFLLLPIFPKFLDFTLNKGILVILPIRGTKIIIRPLDPPDKF